MYDKREAGVCQEKSLARVDIVNVARKLGYHITEKTSGTFCPCPVTEHEHDDTRPGCKLGGDNSHLWFCFKCEAEGDPVGLVKAAKGCDAAAAFQWLRDNHFLPDDSQHPSPSPPNPITQLCQLRGWKPSALDALNVETNGRNVKFPMRDHEGTITGYKSRRADNKPFSIRGGDDVKSLTGKGEQMALVYPDGLADAPDPVVICEGEADAAAALSAGHKAVVATPGATAGRRVRGYLGKLVAGRDVVLSPDPDEAGRQWRDKVGGTLANVQCSVRYISPEDDRDLDDRLRYGDVALTVLLDDALPWEHPDSEPEKAITEQMLKDCTDAGNADLLAALHGDTLRWDHRRERWLVWGEHWWTDDPDGVPQRLALDVARYRAEHAYGLGDDKAKRVFKWAVNSRQNHRVTSALELAKITRPIADTGEGWDQKPWKLGCENGVVDLRSGKLEDGVRDDRITRHVPHSYNPDAKPTLWLQFLEEIFDSDEALINFVHRAVGYTLTGSTREQVFFVLFGRGSNGKGVFMETLRHVLGPYAYDAGFSTFEDNKGYAGHSEAVAELAGTRFVTASETSEGSKLNEQRLKALSHGDTTSAAFKYKKRFEFKPECKIWLGLNHKPKVQDDSLGFWRSVRLIPFNVQFTDTGEPGPDRDKNLVEKLKREAPAILSWAVRGAVQWQQDGLQTPETVERATEAYENESDPLARFVSECCTLNANAATPSGELYKAYQEWAEREGIPKREQVSHTSFGRRMGATFEKKRLPRNGRKPRCYVGIGLIYD